MGATALLVVVGIGATAWAVHAASPAADDTVLTVSDPQHADSGPGTAGRPGTASRPGQQTPTAKPKPAQVGRPAPSQVRSERPLAVTLASGTTMRVRVSATAADGELQIPPNINQAGWWDGGSKLGDPYGSIVVAAHIDSFTQGLGSFAELLSVQSGDVIHLDSAHLSQSFRVVWAHLVPKTSLTASSPVLSARGSSRLVLITCGGPYDPSRGGYQSNMIVVASPEGALASRR